MLYQGVLTKMKTEFSAPINYFLSLGDSFIQVHQLINKSIKLKFIGYECLSCGSGEQTFRQGFCKSCFFELPQTADWIMRPELSQAHLGIEERDLEYEKKVQLQPHIVYLAYSSHVKVGVTRQTQIPTRWIDQGAQMALEVLEVPNRYLAGVAEVALKQFVSDKTNWRDMLKGDAAIEDLTRWRDQLIKYLPDEVQPYILPNKAPLHLAFPVLKHPDKPKSLNLVKTSEYLGVLVGIKGQYLIFEDGTVFNIRSNEGLVIGLNIEP